MPRRSVACLGVFSPGNVKIAREMCQAKKQARTVACEDPVYLEAGRWCQECDQTVYMTDNQHVRTVADRVCRYLALHVSICLLVVPPPHSGLLTPTVLEIRIFYYLTWVLLHFDTFSHLWEAYITTFDCLLKTHFLARGSFDVFRQENNKPEKVISTATDNTSFQKPFNQR